MTLSVDLGVTSVIARQRGGGGGGPSWPADTVALWLILGQSNAEGYAPWRQDPARVDAAAAVPYLTPDERAAHPWIRFSTRTAVANAGQFPATGQGLATDAPPRTSSRVWTTEAHGIPVGTPAFGPEVGLIRHVLGGGAPPAWRDDAAPRLYVFKQTEGGRSVDHFRWGGPGQALVLDALREAGGENLSSLAAAKTVLVQGVIFVIGEKDATTPMPDGTGTMADTLVPRFTDWVRQIRAALGMEAPIAFVEIHDAVDARKRTANAALATLAATLPNAAVIPRTAAWSEVGDGIHYDAAGQDALGAAVFAHFRDAYGRPGDGLVSAFPFAGLRPWFHVPPVFTDDNGSYMRIAATAAASGMIHARVTAQDAPVPDAAAIRDQAGLAGGFSRAVTQDVQAEWLSPSGSFVANATQDCHFVLEDATGALSAVVTTRRGGNAKFAPDLKLTTAGATTADFTVKPTFPGALHWALFAGDRDAMRPEDIEAMAFEPLQAGSMPCSANQQIALSLGGLAPATAHTLLMTGARTYDGARSVTQRVAFVTA